jgi:ubiquinone/menaquinone biosynthesis C-methylase UbiE
MYYWLSNKFFHPTYKKKLAQSFFKLIPNNSFILDVGAGKGCISKHLKNLNPTLKTICFDIKKSNFIDVNGDGSFLPFKDKSFDITIVVDMLHHTTNIIKILKELKRVSKKYIIIKEQGFTSRTSKFLILLGDSLTNKNCKIYNHLNYLTWKEIFEELNLSIIEEPKKINLGFFLNEKMNQIFKLRNN